MQSRHLGLSLVELMISLLLGVILMGGVVHIFLSSQATFHTQQGLSRVQESGRLAMEFVSEDIRMAGYMGCLDKSLQPESSIASPDAFWENFAEPIRGYRASSVPTALSGLSPSPLAGSELVVVRSAKGAMHYLTQANAVGEFKVQAGSVNGVSLKADQPAVVSSCVAARIFKPSAVVAGGSVTAATTISHSGTWGGGSYNPSESFEAGAEMIPVSTTVYFVANNPAGQPALYQKTDGQASMELIEGVESMAFQFGVDTNNDGVVNQYYATQSVPDWQQVSSARVRLLVRSNEMNVLEEAQGYIFNDVAVAADDNRVKDKRLRQTFTSLVVIRGRTQ